MFLRYAIANEVPEMCAELCEMIADVRSNRAQPMSVRARTIPTSPKLTSDGGCQLTEAEKTAVARQLRETRGPTNIPLSEARLLVQMVGSVIYS